MIPIFWTSQEQSKCRQEALGKALPAAIKKLVLTNLPACADCDAQTKSHPHFMGAMSPTALLYFYVYTIADKPVASAVFLLVI